MISGTPNSSLRALTAIFALIASVSVALAGLALMGAGSSGTPVASGPTWAYVSTANHNCIGDSGVTTATCTASAGITAGNTVIVCAWGYGNATAPTALAVTDNHSNTLTPLGTMYSSVTGVAIQLFDFKYSSNPGSTTWTATQTGATGTSFETALNVNEYSGLTPTLDSAAVGNYTTTANATSASFTPGTTGDLMFGCAASASTSPTAGTGWTARQHYANWIYQQSEDLAAPAASPQTALFTNAAASMLTSAAAFK